MSSIAPDLVCQVPEFGVSDHAIRRRLDAEGVSPSQREWVLHAHRAVAEKVILMEVSRARLLLPDARRVLTKPWREKVHGAPIAKRRRPHGATPQSLPFRSFGGEHYLFGEHCYIVDHQTVVTMLTPTHAELDTLEGVMRQGIAADERLISIFRLAQECAPDSAMRAKIIGPVSQPANRIEPVRPQTIFLRARPSATGLLTRPEGSWSFVILDDVRSRESLVRDVASWLRRTFPDQRPDPVFIDAFSPELVKVLKRRLGKCRLLSLPTPPEIDWTTVGGGHLPAAAIHWWERLLRKTSPAGNKLVTLVLPETARIIFEIADGSSIADWRNDPSSFDPGTVCDVCLPERIPT